MYLEIHFCFGTVACASFDTSRYGLKRKSRTSVLLSVVDEPEYYKVEYINYYSVKLSMREIK